MKYLVTMESDHGGGEERLFTSITTLFPRRLPRMCRGSPFSHRILTSNGATGRATHAFHSFPLLDSIYADTLCYVVLSRPRPGPGGPSPLLLVILSTHPVEVTRNPIGTWGASRCRDPVLASSDIVTHSLYLSRNMKHSYGLSQTSGDIIPLQPCQSHIHCLLKPRSCSFIVKDSNIPGNSEHNGKHSLRCRCVWARVVDRL